MVIHLALCDSWPNWARGPAVQANRGRASGQKAGRSTQPGAPRALQRPAAFFLVGTGTLQTLFFG